MCECRYTFVCRQKYVVVWAAGWSVANIRLYDATKGMDLNINESKTKVVVCNGKGEWMTACHIVSGEKLHQIT